MRQACIENENHLKAKMQAISETMFSKYGELPVPMTAEELKELDKFMSENDNFLFQGPSTARDLPDPPAELSDPVQTENIAPVSRCHGSNSASVDNNPDRSIIPLQTLKKTNSTRVTRNRFATQRKRTARMSTGHIDKSK